MRSRFGFRMCMVLVLALVSAASCYAWDVTNVYVRVSQDDQGNITTWTDTPTKWTGADATWVRGMNQDITYIDNQGHITYGDWPDAKIVRMGAFHEYDPTRKYNMFYGMAPLGYDAYFMHTGNGWYDPTSKAYMGTNFFSGTKVKDILTLQYSAQVTYRAHPDSEDGFTLWGQPPMIELNTDSSSTSAQQRQFIFKPWGPNALQTSPAGNTWECGWQTIDATGSETFWLQMLTSSSDCKGNWTWLMGRYSDKSLRAPIVGDLSQGYSGLSLRNPSGTSFSVRLGAPKVVSDLNGYNYGECWILEAQDNWSFFDKVVVGIADERDGIGQVVHETRYTFDFENSTTPVPTLGAMQNAARKLGIVKQLEEDNLFVVYGKVILTPDWADTGYVAGQLFTIDDGSGSPVRVICPGNDVAPPNEFTPDWVRVEGRLYNIQDVDPRFTYLDPTSVYRQLHKHEMQTRPDLVYVYPAQ